MCTQRPTLLIQSQIIASFSQKWYYISPTFYRISVSLQKLSCSISRRRLRKLGLTIINNNFTFHELKSSHSNFFRVALFVSLLISFAGCGQKFQFHLAQNCRWHVLVVLAGAKIQNKSGLMAWGSKCTRHSCFFLFLEFEQNYALQLLVVLYVGTDKSCFHKTSFFVDALTKKKHNTISEIERQFPRVQLLTTKKSKSVCVSFLRMIMMVITVRIVCRSKYFLLLFTLATCCC